MAKLATKPDAADSISGPAGTITIRLHAIPKGIGASDWIDSYLDAHAADFPSGCLSGGGAPQEHVTIGDDGRLLQLDCLPGWMLVVAQEDRLYDLRFKVAGGGTPADKALFMAMIQGLMFLPGTLPSLAP